MSLVVDRSPDDHRPERMREEIRRGLTRRPREIPPKYLYDEVGSNLFERICAQPEYYLPGAERQILARIGGHVAETTGAEELLELGPGASTKNLFLLDPMARAGRLRRYLPIDLDEPSVRRMSAALLDRYPGLGVHAIIADFSEGLERIPPGSRRLLTFLGSTIGNFRPDETVDFLSRVATRMAPGDSFLLGTDLVKDVRVLEAAYNDGAGVTAEFNRNILRVMNRQLGANFDSEAFEHRAIYNSGDHWIEMRLASTRDQSVRFPALDLELRLETGEEILTEISAKYDLPRLDAMLSRTGFRLIEWHTDDQHLFAVSLSRRL